MSVVYCFMLISSYSLLLVKKYSLLVADFKVLRNVTHRPMLKNGWKCVLHYISILQASGCFSAPRTGLKPTLKHLPAWDSNLGNETLWNKESSSWLCSLRTLLCCCRRKRCHDELQQMRLHPSSLITPPLVRIHSFVFCFFPFTTAALFVFVCLWDAGNIKCILKIQRLSGLIAKN